MSNQRWLSRQFFVFFLTWGVFLPYWTGWLVAEKNMSISEASVIMGVGLIARAASTMFVFPLASKYFSNRQVVLLCTVLSLMSLLLYFPSSSFGALLLVTLFFSMFYPILLPAIDSSATPLMQLGVHYGKSRSYGSIGYVVAVLVVSVLTGICNESAILWSMFVGLFVLGSIQLLPAPVVLSTKPTLEERKKSSSMLQLFAYKQVVVVLVIVILLQGSHASYYHYAYIYLQHLHVHPFYIGIVLNVAVLFEILYFIKSDGVFVKWRVSSLLMLAAVGSTIRWLMIYLFPNVWVFIIAQSLHALSFGVAHVAFISFITTYLPKQQIPNAQGLYSAIGMSLSAAILTVFGGYLYKVEPQLAFLGMTICTMPAIILIGMTRGRYQY